ncbi:unnamed protein product [Brassica oleracea]
MIEVSPSAASPEGAELSVERLSLIERFWKESLLLSSLHHPNVLSFYWIVRDGPDGSLATFAEFMVNGSLKQFLQKKHRTIDRGKRLINIYGFCFWGGIGDLGLPKVKQKILVSGDVRGTLPWMAHELLSGKSNVSLILNPCFTRLGLCDPEWKGLMESCWASEPIERPSFAEISQKPRNMAAATNLK